MRLKKIAALALSAAMALSVMAPAALAAAPDDSENCIAAVQEFFDKMTSSNYTYLYAALDWNEYWANENVYAAAALLLPHRRTAMANTIWALLMLCPVLPLTTACTAAASSR